MKSENCNAMFIMKGRDNTAYAWEWILQQQMLAYSQDNLHVSPSHHCILQPTLRNFKVNETFADSLIPTVAYNCLHTSYWGQNCWG